MTAELSLILLLLISVVLLVYLLYTRIKEEKKQEALLQDLSNHELTDFMNKNSLDGSVSAVARLFSDILKKSFRCQYIVFVRKKRGMLELNYYHGIKSFNRNDFRLEYSTELKKILKENYFPRDIAALEPFLTDKFRNKLNSFQMDKFFPVFWRDNLYGFYVIKSNPKTNSESFRVVIAQLVQSLAAAYHIKWHESKFEQLQERIVGSKISATVREGDQQVERVLQFLKCKKTDAIIPQIVRSLQEIPDVEDLVFVYDNKNHESIEVLFAGKQSLKMTPPKRDDLLKLSEMIHYKSVVHLDEVTKKNSDSNIWVDGLKHHAINRIAAFPLSHNRQGLLAWKQTGDSAEISQRISFYRKYFVDIFENVEEIELLEELSFTDNLTSLSNRRYFYKRLDEELNRSQRYGRNLALIIFDIDELKSINDTHGHQAGDEVIKQVGGLLKKFIRTIDVVARYGGDEFCIIMPESDSQTCMKFVERLQNKISNSNFEIDVEAKPITCTISMGVAVYPDHADNSKNLIYAADMALLKAKSSGRNRALIATNSIKTT